MGYILKAICENCNYEDKVSMGFGMYRPDPFNVTYDVPALYHRAKSLRTKNLYDESLKGKYTFYTDPKMYLGKVEDCPIEFAKESIRALENYCPKCKLFMMSFEVEAEWD